MKSLAFETALLRLLVFSLLVLLSQMLQPIKERQGFKSENDFSLFKYEQCVVP